jgi:O-antigen/teichoic acid export membrane protein
MRLVESILTIATSQGLRIAILIAQSKAVALILGPQGLALLSIYRNLQQTVVIAAGLGLPSGAVREIASAKANDSTVKAVVQAFSFSMLVQAAFAVLLMIAFHAQIAQFAFGKPSLDNAVFWLAICVGASLYSSIQTTILQGLRETKAVAKVTVLGSLGGLIVGVPSVYFFDVAGLVVFVLMQSVSMAVVSRHYVRKIRLDALFPISCGSEFLKTWKPMLYLGFAFMLSGLASSATLLITRAHVVNLLGLDAAGQFSAAWVVSVQYLGFLLTAMAVDYYPRLTSVISNPVDVQKVVNNQMEITLIIGIPLIFLMIGFSSVFTTILYSSEFGVAADLLVFQMLGSILKLAIWPFSYLVVAKGESRLFLLTELLWNALYLGMVFIMLPQYGVMALGYAFVWSYALYAVFVAFAVGWGAIRSLTLFAVLMILSSVLLGLLMVFLRSVSHASAMILACIGTAVYLVLGFKRMLRLIEKTSKLGKFFGRYFRVGV